MPTQILCNCLSRLILAVRSHDVEASVFVNASAGGSGLSDDHRERERKERDQDQVCSSTDRTDDPRATVEATEDASLPQLLDPRQPTLFEACALAEVVANIPASTQWVVCRSGSPLRS